ncbi:biotin--[acetyl-CoA-carboxylase] ligase [Terracoccus sp. 273MFTsu3.1]|uniref:biotin--[acetyl-CoA-carboxylase] ligase n=1 Tax=Terracoccus sp. 273MFTsu3.1 TaxID=1172188 RepID=UPI001E2C0571|nr:biotin--[acetyl-CoA-carboxylase] ligase [Terracoccus sp. 273MFTsu3.1]
MRDLLDIETVSAALVTSGRPWREVEFHPALGSTNTRLRELLTGTAEQTGGAGPTGPCAAGRLDDDAGLWWVVLTDHQTGGRGRLGRAWTVPDRASIAVSVALPVAAPAQAGWMPLLAGLALSRAVRRVTEATGAALTARLKWPNDVLLAEDGDRKLSGILCELVTVGSGQVVVVGTGVNIDQSREELPVDTATSLALAGARVSREDVLVAYLDELTSVLAGAGVGTDASGAPGAAQVRTAYREACSTIGLTVRVHLPTGDAVEGTAVGVDDDGALVVRTDHGVRTFAAGDVVHVRPAAGGLA